MRIVLPALIAALAASPASAEAPAPIRPPMPALYEEKDEALVLARKAKFAEAMQQVEERMRVFESAGATELEGSFAQGGLVFGRTAPGATVRLDGEAVIVGDDGRFVIGFGRDSALSALLTIETPDGAVERRALAIADREFPVQRIDGLDQSKVSEFTEEQLAKIAADRVKKDAARKTSGTAADWANGFDWPVRGRISGVFGSQRILNGEPKTPHSGLDVAAPEGTTVLAPADGVVRLAEPDMYFEGGLVFIDHGHRLESALMHMSRLDVATGQRVAKGEPIGAVGATGRATGPHMHWSVRWAGTLVDPRLLVDPDEAGGAAAGD